METCVMPETTSAIRLIIVDDQAVMRQSIRRLLQHSGEMHVVAEASDGDEAIDTVNSVDADIVLLDISMPRRNGLDVLEVLKREHPSLPVLMLSIHSAEQYERRAIELGAAAFVNKENAADQLVDAIRAALR